MKIKLFVAGLLAVAGAIGAVQAVGFAEMRFTVHVLDEDGHPLPGLHSTFVFKENLAELDKPTKISVTTDENGNFTVDAHSNDGVPTFDKSLNKDGYYESGIPMSNFYTFKDGEWQPWDQTYTTVMRKVGNRVPLYVIKMGSDIPAVGVPCGYDLEQADWVAPYGKGTTTDFIVTLTNRVYNAFQDFDVSATITFPNDGDGIQEIQLPKEFANSQFKWPREAPETGYQPQMEVRNALFPSAQNKPAITTWKENQTYFFRVRTVKQGDQIVSALYGKINSGISLEPRGAKICDFGFIYYLNPTPNDRNLEFSGSTLFKNLPQSETTHVP